MITIISQASVVMMYVTEILKECCARGRTGDLPVLGITDQHFKDVNQFKKCIAK